MALPRELFAGFVWCEGLTDAEAREDAYLLIKSKLKFIPPPLHEGFSRLCDDYSVYERFTPLEVMAEVYGQAEVPTFDEARSLFHSQLVIWESNDITASFSSLTLIERKKAVSVLSNLVLEATSESIDLPSLKDKDWSKSFIRSSDTYDDRVILPFRQVNVDKALNTGDTVTVMAGPASGKTSLALNIAYLNAFIRPYRTLYIYLENLEQNYFSELLARHSYVTGLKIENRSLKAGVLPSETEGVKKINELIDRFKSDMRGNITFTAFTGFSSDPARFGNMLGKVADDYGVDIVIFDYAQRAAQFNNNPRLDANTYVNRIVDTIASAALGMYNNKGFIAVILSQLNRDAMKKSAKTNSLSFGIYDASGSSALDRTSFLMLGLYSNPQMRAENRCAVKVLKNRDGPEWSESDDNQPFIPQFCYMGDFDTKIKASLDSVFSMDTILDIEGFGV